MTDDQLLSIYKKGFKDELDSVNYETFSTEIETRAYQLGTLAAIAGEDVRGIDYQSDDEILKEIKA